MTYSGDYVRQTLDIEAGDASFLREPQRGS